MKAQIKKTHYIHTYQSFIYIYIYQSQCLMMTYSFAGINHHFRMIEIRLWAALSPANQSNLRCVARDLKLGTTLADGNVILESNQNIGEL